MIAQGYTRARRGLRHRLNLPGARPDFLLIGFTKTATTTMYDRLASHPQVEPSAAKELHFFDYRYDRGPEWYGQQFPSRARLRLSAMAQGRRFLTGEASPSYVDHPLAPARVREMLPDAKLIVQLRNPIDRAYSHYQMSYREDEEDLPTFEEALDAEEGRLAGEVEKVRTVPGYRSWPLGRWSYLRRGRYAEHIEPWLELFPREQLLVVTLDELEADWNSALGRYWSFLGLPEHDAPPVRLRAGGSYEPMADATRDRLREYFAPHNARLSELLGIAPDWS